MVIELNRGENVRFEEIDPSITKLRVDIDWASADIQEHEIDIAVFLLTDVGVVRDADELIFHAHPVSANGAVRLCDVPFNLDARLRREAVEVDLPEIPQHVVRIVICASIYDRGRRGLSFAQIDRLSVRCVDTSANIEIVSFKPAGFDASKTAIVCSELCRDGHGWQYMAVGRAIAGGFAALCEEYAQIIVQQVTA
ncbi:TerD family protein [Pseudoduganella buxea]|uniref:TerD domain-containing protein n=1 Tax=Pseudoduganella buxea TaxID=1949069 RepID=A0A6I3SY13_9BURK|nr:TerD family protein [Pseudoduganella buxea]MTV53545.1 hypothetical protein [Pseudoduganella buxea]GGC22990.1 hypothetical protein GCM10011572_50620 [Pseudoduganella buxea]